MTTTINAQARIIAGEVSTEVKGVLKRMAFTVDPQHAIERNPNLLLKNNTCHGQVALGIRQRGIPDDLIWLYGVGKDVAHSVLTDEDHRVLVDSFKHKGKFMAAEGYSFDDDRYDLVDVLPVSELYDEYMSYQVHAEAEGGESKSNPAEKSRKEALDRQLETNKQQQEKLREGVGEVPPVQKLDKQKQVNQLKDRALDLRKQKLES